MSEGSSGSPYSAALGDYDMPIEETVEHSSKLAKLITKFPFSPSELSKLHLTGGSSGSRSDESDEESSTTEKIKFFEHYNIAYRNIEMGSDDAKFFDFDKSMISEDEKKRLRNTEAARRCREKIKNRTEELEGTLTNYVNKNDAMNQNRIRLLSQIEEQIRMLEIMKVRNPHLANSITTEARTIVDTYKNAVATRRKALADYYAQACSRIY